MTGFYFSFKEIEGRGSGMRLTRVEGHLADHDPSVREMKPQFHVFADSVVELDGDVSRRLEDLVLHVGVGDRLPCVIPASNAEQYIDLGKYLEQQDFEN